MALSHSLAEFAAALAQGGKLAGLDVGTKTIGLALCDTSWSFAGPAETIARTKFSIDLVLLRQFVAKHAVVGLVVGLASTSTAATRLVPSRSAPLPATSCPSPCHCCCGTSAGRPRRSSER